MQFSYIRLDTRLKSGPEVNSTVTCTLYRLCPARQSTNPEFKHWRLKFWPPPSFERIELGTCRTRNRHFSPHQTKSKPRTLVATSSSREFNSKLANSHDNNNNANHGVSTVPKKCNTAEDAAQIIPQTKFTVSHPTWSSDALGTRLWQAPASAATQAHLVTYLLCHQ